MISAKVIADSVNAYTGERLVTVEATHHRFILAELNTHRAFSRNSASSRAIPANKLIERVVNDPALPLVYKANQAGMQAAEELSPGAEEACERAILALRDEAVRTVGLLNQHNLHKQWTNRYLEPWMWHTVIITSSEWDNFFKQRISPLAQPEIDGLAYQIKAAMDASFPVSMFSKNLHLPYIQEDEWDVLPEHLLAKVSAARCARVSYLTHDGVRDIMKDIDLYNKLVTANPPHWSPLEHVALPWTPSKWYNLRKQAKPLGNFDTWHQLRHNPILAEPKFKLKDLK